MHGEFDYDQHINEVGAPWGRRRRPAGRPAAQPARPGAVPQPAMVGGRASKVATATLNEYYSTGYFKGLALASAQLVTSAGRMLFAALDTAPTGGQVTALPSGAKDALVGNFPVKGDKLGLERGFEFAGLSWSWAANHPSFTPDVMEEFLGKASLRICVGAQPLAAADKIMIAELPNPFERSGGTTSSYDRKNEVGGRDPRKSFFKLDKPLFVPKDKGFTIMLDEIPSTFASALNATFTAGQYIRLLLHLHRVRMERPLGVSIDA